MMKKLILAITAFALISASLATDCSDGSVCPGTETCCTTDQGTGCCPYENAACCSDGLHCCPSGYTCNLAQGSCDMSSKNEFLTFLETPKMAKLGATLTTPSFSDIYKCIMDIKPAVTDIMAMVEDYKKGDKQALEKELIQLLADGEQLGEDCLKVFKSLQ